MSTLDEAAREAAIEAQIIARFDAASITRHHDQPNVTNVRLLESEVAKVATSFATQYFGGDHGHLAAVLTEAKVRRVASDTNLDCTAPTKPPLINPSIEVGDTGTALELKHAEQRKLCADYFLHRTIVKIGVKVVTAAFGKEYTEVLDLEYIGFANQTILTTIAHLRTWYTITDSDQDDAEENFRAPWSDFPNSHISTYARRLTRLQNEAMDVNLEITDATKLRVLVKSIRASGLFTRKFLDKYEDSTTQKTWTVQLPLFVVEYAKIMRAAGRADADAEYESAAALREDRRRTDDQRPTSRGTSAAAVDNPDKGYKAAMEYAAALEEHIAKLTEGGANAAGAPVPSAFPTGGNVNEEASALTTGTAGTAGTAGPLVEALRQEMRAQTAASDLQMAKLTAAIASMTAPGNTGATVAPVVWPRGKRPTADAAKGERGKHVCKNCKRLVYHKDSKCMELPANASSRYEGWVSCFSAPIT